jgi:dephospho-CoA kinase
MLKLGLTGGIGSGKTTIANIFIELGVPVFFADDEAKKFLLNNNVKSKLALHFGNHIIDFNGEINKAELAKIVFSDSNKLEKLNAIIHPLLMKEFEHWSSEKKRKNNALVVLEAAILFEAGFDKFVNKTLTVSANIEDRIKRVIKRDSTQYKLVVDRINSQMSDEERELLSDIIINNSNNNMIVERVIEIYNSLLESDLSNKNPRIN